jgi:hypothetical protein
LRKLLALSVLTLGVAATSTAQAESLRIAHKPWSQMTRAQTIDVLKRQIHRDRSVIRFWKHHRDLATVHRDVASTQTRWARISLKIAAPNLHRLVASRLASRVVGSVKSALLCIHSHEGSWSDPGYPYWGGLQMDMNFQSAYGPEFLRRWGTADRWPVYAQLQAGARAVAARGFSPWPNTRKLCGV